MLNRELYTDAYMQQQFQPFYNYVMLRESYEQFIRYDCANGNPSAEDFFHYLLKQRDDPKRQLISDEILNQVATEIHHKIDSIQRKKDLGRFPY